MSWWRRRLPMRCDDFVERITDYLDGAVDDDARARIDRHLRGCSGCTRALDQWRVVIRVTGRITDDDVDRLDDGVRAELTAAFVEARRGDG